MSSNKQIIFGIHAVTSLLDHQPDRVTRIFIQRERRDSTVEEMAKKAAEHDISVEYLPKREIDKLAHDENHQGVIAYCQQMRIYDEHDLKQLLVKLTVPPFLLILDGIQDPQNLGACFRSADAAGVHAIIAPKDKAVGLTPVVSKVASGAMETVPFVQVTNLARTLEMLKELGVWIYGAAGEAEKTIYETDLNGPVALVLGGEGDGMRRLTREHCDALVKIPMFGTVQSLNVSVAAGIVMFEAVRQRQK
jgi:23S rRNA (guanosine2251-2'-O)-methyltransferase